MEIDRLIGQANERLKRGRVGLVIQQRGNRLWFRGTLPPKPGNTSLKRYQQRFAADLPANPVGVQHAERKAKLIGAKLALGEFSWVDWMDSPKVALDTCGDWAARMEADYWANCRRSTSTQNSWVKIADVLKKLPQDTPLTLEVLLQVVLTTSPDSRIRQRTCMVLGRLAKKVGLDSSAIAALSGNYSPRSVEPKTLPTDEEIATWRDKIDHPGWKYLFSLQAVYGLRNHELFHVNHDEFPTLWVEDPTKTGKRFVYPVFPEWASLWELNQPIWPDLKGLQDVDRYAWDNTILGTRVSKWFNRFGIPFTPYGLRHAYARRCFECGITPDLAAKLMGHSLVVHTKIYRAWIEEQTYRKAYEVAMARRSVE
jgi:integrase